MSAPTTTGVRLLLALAAAGLSSVLMACGASGTTANLVDARKTYARAETSKARVYAPDSLLEARSALDAAERAHEDDPNSARERHLAYIAKRRAGIAIADGAARALTRDARKTRVEYEGELEWRTLSAERRRARVKRELTSIEGELSEVRKALHARGNRIDDQTLALQRQETELEARSAELRWEQQESQENAPGATTCADDTADARTSALSPN
jgi:hypothetical protein